MDHRQRRFTVPEHVLFQEMEGETVLLNLEDGHYYGLDPLGTQVWRMLKEGKDTGECLDWILDHYEVSRKRAENDLRQLLAQMEEKGLLIPAGE